MFAPSCASRMASAAPMPRAAPVTTAIRPSSLKGHLSQLGHTTVHTQGGVVFVTYQLIVYEMNLCVQNRYIHLWMHYLLALWRDRMRFGVGRPVCSITHPDVGVSAANRGLAGLSRYV